jgi:hypothetical protein
MYVFTIFHPRTRKKVVRLYCRARFGDYVLDALLLNAGCWRLEGALVELEPSGAMDRCDMQFCSSAHAKPIFAAYSEANEAGALRRAIAGNQGLDQERPAVGGQLA